MGPCVPFVFVTECTIGVWVCEGPEYVFPMIAHILGVSEF